MTKKYSYEDALKLSTEYFYDDKLAAKVFIDKYAMRDADDNVLEPTPNLMHDRLAREFARIDSEKYGLVYQERYDLYRSSMDRFARICPQGSPMAAVGNPHKLMSASNCVVVESPRDSMEGIMETGNDLAQLMKRRCGVGVDISTLRPTGSSVNNAARTTSGAWSFADYYSYVTRMVGQNNRRGALMITLDVHHPDVINFIKMKNDLTKVTGANVSLRLSDEFLMAVDTDSEYELRWPCEGKAKIKYNVRAREVWDTIVASATKVAEPGLTYWNSMVNNLPPHCYPQFKTISTNPCCFSKTSNVLVETLSGLKEIKQITKQDKVWIDSEKIWAATSGYFDAGAAEIFEVKFSNNSIIEITSNHKLETTDNKLVKLKDLNVGSKINLSLKETNANLFTTIESIRSIGFGDVGCIEVPEYHKFTANGIISGNSEIALSAYDSCRLISLNLTGYVSKAFEKIVQFDFDLFRKDIRTAMQMADNLVDIELELIEKIKTVCEPGHETELWDKLSKAGHDGRRTGLGTHGLADTLAQLRIRYDSPEALKMVDEIYKTLRDVAYETSVDLAEVRGSFPVYDYNLEKDCEFIKRLPKKIKDKMKVTGRRNIAALTQAPTGSLSIVSKVGEFEQYNVSSGVEPVFRNSYTRRKKINYDDKNNATVVDFVDNLGDSWQEFKVYHSNVKNYIKKFNLNDDAELPDYFVCSDEIDWEKRIEIQGTEQQYIDHSISSTINLPKGTPESVVSNLYLKAWKSGLKGVTVYVDGSRDGVLITEPKAAVTTVNQRPEEIVPVMAPKRPKEMSCDIHHVTVKGVKYTVLVGLLKDSPYELFMGHSELLSLPSKCSKGQIVKHSRGKYNLHVHLTDDELVVKDILKVFDNKEMAWATRLLSLSLRHGVAVDFLADQMSKEGEMNDINKIVARILKKYIKDGMVVRVGSSKCEGTLEDGSPCTNPQLVYSEGCVKCLNCSYSRCS